MTYLQKCFQSTKYEDIKSIVVCGPSGSGKTTLLEKAILHFNDKLKFSVSHTTRKPRPNEIEGQSYYFIDVETFQNMINNNKFIEYSKFSECYYGTSYEELYKNTASGFISLLDIDIRGVINLMKSNFNAKYIFIKPPSIEFLEENLRKRATETENSIRLRLKHAMEDMQTASTVKFDMIIVNQDLDLSFKTLKEYLQTEIDLFKKHSD